MAELPGSSGQTERGGNDDVQARICWSFRSCAYCGHLECERPEPSTRKPCLNYIYCHSNSPRQTDACRRGERVYGAQHGYGGVKRRWQSGAGQDGQKEIGQMLGGSRETTNKCLRSWERRNWVRLDRARIEILRPEALNAIANAEVIIG